MRDKKGAPPGKVDFEALIQKVSNKGDKQDNTISLVVDNSKKEIGSLLKLNSL